MFRGGARKEQMVMEDAKERLKGSEEGTAAGNDMACMHEFAMKVLDVFEGMGSAGIPCCDGSKVFGFFAIQVLRS